MSTFDERLGRRAVVAGGIGAVGVALSACGAPSASAPTSSGSASTQPTPTGTSSGSSPVASTPPVLTQHGPDIKAGSRSSTSVALTFHGSGDPAMARELLDILAAHQAHVTVFAVGNWATQQPAVLHRIVADGHDLGNHTWSHQAMTTLSAAAADTEVASGAAAVAAIRGSAGPLFRPSGTPTSTPTIRAAASKAGYARCISYDVDSLDYTDPGAAAVRDNVRRGLHGGAIVSLHFAHKGTLQALPQVLTDLTDHGLRSATVTQLLSEPGAPIYV